MAGQTPTRPRADSNLLLVRAVAGRRVGLGEAGTALAHSDGSTIYLRCADTLADRRRSAVVQAALIAVGSFDRSIMHRLLRARGVAAQRYLLLEAVRAGNDLREVIPHAVVAAVAEVYPGPVSHSSEESLTRALRGERLPDPPAWFGAIRPLKVVRTGPDAGGAAPTERDRLGGAQQNSLPELSEDDAETSDRSKIMDLLSAPMVGNPLGAALQRMLGMGRAAGTGGAGAELPIGGHRSGPVGARARRALGFPTTTMSAAAAPLFGTRYPEWNWADNSYRIDWCTVGELDPAPSEKDEAPDPAVDTELRAALGRLGLSWERYRRQDEGTMLDLTALVDYRISVAAGGGGEPKVYENSRRTGRDLGVLVLLDATGSAAEQARGRAVFDDQRRVAGQLTAAFDQLGVRVATHAFYSRGRRSVRMLRVKDFDDRYDARARSRLSALEPAGFTRLGAVFRHGTQLLTARAGTANLLMIVVGDGLPYDEWYADRYAREDSRRALREAAERGVACVGITTGPDGANETATWIWAEASRCVVRDSRDLARAVPGVFGPALRKAATRRRRVGGSHRKERIAS